MHGRRIPITTRFAGAVALAMVVGASCGSTADEAAPDTTPLAIASSTSDPSEDTPVNNPTNDPANDIAPAQGQPEPAANTSDIVADVASPVADASTDNTSSAQSTPAVTVASQDAVEQVAEDRATSSCRRITDFDGGTAGDNWIIVNDGVMGGRSNGAVDISDSVMSFTGSVVTAGGGFTSVRYRLIGGEMADSTSLKLRVRADQRIYGVTLEDDAEVGRRSVSHRADFDTSGAGDADGWSEVTLDYSELKPSVFGQSVDAPPFDPDSAREIGIIIADGTDGAFALEVDWIDVCS